MPSLLIRRTPGQVTHVGDCELTYVDFDRTTMIARFTVKRFKHVVEFRVPLGTYARVFDWRFTPWSINGSRVGLRFEAPLSVEIRRAEARNGRRQPA